MFPRPALHLSWLLGIWQTLLRADPLAASHNFYNHNLSARFQLWLLAGNKVSWLVSPFQTPFIPRKATISEDSKHWHSFLSNSLGIYKRKPPTRQSRGRGWPQSAAINTLDLLLGEVLGTSLHSSFHHLHPCPQICVKLSVTLTITLMRLMRYKVFEWVHGSHSKQRVDPVLRPAWLLAAFCQWAALHCSLLSPALLAGRWGFWAIDFKNLSGNQEFRQKFEYLMGLASLGPQHSLWKEARALSLEWQGLLSRKKLSKP